MTKVTARRNNQNNIISIGNTERRYFSHFGTIDHNLFRGFERDNNNPLPLPLSGFGGGFNSLPKKKLRELDPNIAILVNTLMRVNLKINYIERKSNHMKLIKFRKMKVEDPNK